MPPAVYPPRQTIGSRLERWARLEVLERALARQRGEEHANALVYRSHHRRAAADFFLGASMH